VCVCVCLCLYLMSGAVGHMVAGHHSHRVCRRPRPPFQRQPPESASLSLSPSSLSSLFLNGMTLLQAIYLISAGPPPTTTVGSENFQNFVAVRLLSWLMLLLLPTPHRANPSRHAVRNLRQNALGPLNC
jgi:hypothetical protein